MLNSVLDRLLGIDPTGFEAAVLCAVTGALFAVLIGLGFLLVRQAERAGRRWTQRNSGELAEPDVLALWRLNRSLGRRPSAAEPLRTSSHSPDQSWLDDDLHARPLPNARQRA